DLRDAHYDGDRERRLLSDQRERGTKSLPECRSDELRGAADQPGVADLRGIALPHLPRLLPADPEPGVRSDALVEALDGDHLRDAGGGDHPRAGEGGHRPGIETPGGGRERLAPRTPSP